MNKRRERIRRDERRAARDRKCFSTDDELRPSSAPPKNIPKAGGVKTRKAAPGTAPLAGEELSALMLAASPTGPSVSDLFNGGVMLSSAAAQDMQQMMAGMASRPPRKKRPSTSKPCVAIRHGAGSQCGCPAPPRPHFAIGGE